MAHLTYHRDDCYIRLTLTPEKEAGTLQFRAADWYEDVTVSSYEVRSWLEAIRELQKFPPETDALHRLWHFTTRWMLAYADQWSSDDRTIPRIVLDIRDVEISGFDWEWTISKWFPRPYGWGGPVIVRATPVHAPITETHVTLPLCIRQMAQGDATPLGPQVLSVFGSHPPGAIAAALSVEQLPSGRLDELLIRGSNDPTIDILHFDLVPDPMLFESTASGSKTKLIRIVDKLRTRLVVMSCADEAQAIAARWAGAKLAGSGGPAVLVTIRKTKDDSRIAGFYANLVHNYPVDAALRLASPYPQYETLFVGGGREESLRFSYLSEALGRASARIMTATRPSFTEVAELYAAAGLPIQFRQGRPGGAEHAREDLRSITRDWAALRFEEHEGEGLLPLAASIARLENILSDLLPSQQQQQQQESMWLARFVNTTLWSGPAGSLSEVEQIGTRLLIGEVYHLGVEIGPKSLHVLTLGAQPIYEDVFRWTPEKAGAWIEIAITGLDFDVIGEPLRDLWLPQSGATRRVYFAVSPRVGPAARLRISVYHDQNVVQSLRVVAMTRSSAGEPELPQEVRRAHLAHALAVKARELADLGDLGYLPRLEYSISDANGMAEAPPRTLSIVANDMDGKAVITVKGEVTFDVQQSDISRYVDDVRDALREIANEPVPGGGAGKTQYRFGLDGVRNKGDAKILEDALPKLAEVGRELYVQLFTSAAQLSLKEELEEAGVIHVAHVLLEKVIPWAALYDEDYDHNATGVPQRVCLHSLTLSAEDRNKFRCGEHPNCLKHAAQLATNPANVIVCPLHFWGFRHVIEVPGNQVESLNGKDPKYRTLIQNGKPINAVVAMNQKLELWSPHLDALQSKFRARAQVKEAYARASVMSTIDADSVDIVYLYCHAREDGASKSGSAKGYLEFQATADSQPQRISPGNFSTIRWLHNPIVFINGCETAGFSPRALSPFVRFFMGREAAGVIGTEVDVWEPLACEFAEMFLEAFLAGEPAGDVMRSTREALLAKFNPLGLVYTLYAPAGLTLQKEKLDDA